MLYTKLLLAALLGVSTTSAQLTNSTLLAILNTTQLSPATRFLNLLTSKPEFRPILDLLEQPGNHTIFVPSDKLFADAENHTQHNGTSNGGGGGGGQQSGQNGQGQGQGGGQSQNGGGGGGQQSGQEGQDQGGGQSQNGAQEEGGDNGENQGVGAYIRLPQLNVFQQQNGNSSNGNGGNGTGQSGNGGNNTSGQQPQKLPNETTPFDLGPYKNYNVTDLIMYHIINGTWMLEDLKQNHSLVFHTLVTNQTLDKTGAGLPIVVQNNYTNTTHQQQGGQGGQQNQSSQQPQQSQGNGAYVHLKTRQDQQQGGDQSSDQNGGQQQQGGDQGSEQGGGGGQQQQGGNSTTNGTQPANGVVAYKVGNGNQFANVTIHDIAASNGVLHVIDAGKLRKTFIKS